MAMVYGLMKQHDGMVHVYSELGEGTTVRLYFPKASGQAVEETRIKRPESGFVRGTETILLAEDEAGIRRATTRALERMGYTVLVAEDGEAALEMYRKHSEEIALVISDLIMPKLGGGQLAAALRRENPHVRILFSSGYSADTAGGLVALPEGAEFLQKPWNLEDLGLRVRSMLDLGGDEAPQTTAGSG